MAYDPFNAPAQKFEPEPPVRLYELQRGAEIFRAEIRWRGEFGAELQLYRNGEFVFGRLYENGILAEHQAAKYRKHYEERHWKVQST
jgi:hypothetical protein